jgi:hypothetical protein
MVHYPVKCKSITIYVMPQNCQLLQIFCLVGTFGEVHNATAITDNDAS